MGPRGVLLLLNACPFCCLMPLYLFQHNFLHQVPQYSTILRSIMEPLLIRFLSLYGSTFFLFMMVFLWCDFLFEHVVWTLRRSPFKYPFNRLLITWLWHTLQLRQLLHFSNTFFFILTCSLSSWFWFSIPEDEHRITLNTQVRSGVR